MGFLFDQSLGGQFGGSPVGTGSAVFMPQGGAGNLGFWEQLALAGVGAVSSYLNTKEQAKAAKKMAKKQSQLSIPQQTSYRAQPSFGTALNGGPLMIGPTNGNGQIIPAGWQLNIGGQQGITLGTDDVPPTTTPQAQAQVMGGVSAPMYPTINGVLTAPAAALFRPTRCGTRAVPQFVAVDPASGKMAHYRSAGRPVLYSGDLSACKRVKRVARMASTASGYGRSTRSRKR
jgi:hypothetical protein